MKELTEAIEREVAKRIKEFEVEVREEIIAKLMDNINLKGKPTKQCVVPDKLEFKEPIEVMSPEDKLVMEEVHVKVDPKPFKRGPITRPPKIGGNQYRWTDLESMCEWSRTSIVSRYKQGMTIDEAMSCDAAWAMKGYEKK